MTELVERIASTEARVESLEERFDRHEEKQNGYLQRLETKIDKIYAWLIGLMGGVITSLIILIFNLLRR